MIEWFKRYLSLSALLDCNLKSLSSRCCYKMTGFHWLDGYFPRTWTLTAVVSKLPKRDGCPVSPVYMENLNVKKVALKCLDELLFRSCIILDFDPGGQKLGWFFPLLSVLCPWDGKKVLKEKNLAGSGQFSCCCCSWCQKLWWLRSSWLPSCRSSPDTRLAVVRTWCCPPWELWSAGWWQRQESLFSIRNEAGDYFAEGEPVAVCKVSFLSHKAAIYFCLECTLMPRPDPKTFSQLQENFRKQVQLVAPAPLLLLPQYW